MKHPEDLTVLLSSMADSAHLLVAAALGFTLGAACAANRPATPSVVPLPEPSGAFPSEPPPGIVTPEYGSVLVIYRTADGEEVTLTCGGEVSLAPRKLLKLDRTPP